MSDATPADLEQYLARQFDELVVAVPEGRGRVAAEMSAGGRLRSGSSLREGAAALERILLEHADRIIGEADRWVGPKLPAQLVREIVGRHLRAALERFATLENAAPYPLAQVPASAGAAIETMLRATKDKVESRVRQFELGVRLPTPPATITYNIVHAANVTGSIQQAGGDATQHNSVTLSAEGIAEAVDRLEAAIREFGNSTLESDARADLETLRLQLAKSTPPHGIIRETVHSLRTVIEGAIGGAIGGAATPALSSAFTALLTAAGMG